MFKNNSNLFFCQGLNSNLECYYDESERGIKVNTFTEWYFNGFCVEKYENARLQSIRAK